MEHISVNLIITNILKHQVDFSDLFDDMRETTHEENESINNYIKSISKPTSINIYDIMKQPNKTILGEKDDRFKDIRYTKSN